MKKIKLSILLFVFNFLALLPKTVHAQTKSFNMPCSEGEVVATVDTDTNTMTFSGSGILNTFVWWNYMSGYEYTSYSDFYNTKFQSLFSKNYDVDDIEKIVISSDSNISVKNDGDMFSHFKGLKEIDGIERVDFSECYDLSGMFCGDESLTSINFNNIKLPSDTTNIGCMFDGCKSLEIITGFEKIKTSSSTTNMVALFNDCQNLTSVNLSALDTSGNTRFDEMFQNCYSLASLDLTNFNTSKAENMEKMFCMATGLKTIQFGPKFTTPNVTNMNYMFFRCESLTSLDLSNFDLTNVDPETHKEMLYNLKSIQTLKTPAQPINLGLHAYTAPSSDQVYYGIFTGGKTTLTRAEDVFYVYYWFNGRVYEKEEFYAPAGYRIYAPKPSEAEYYDIDGYYLDADFTTKAESGSGPEGVFHDINVYLKATPKTYTLTKKIEGYDDVTENFSYGDELNLEFPSLEGYDFDGWYSDSEYTTKIETPVSYSSDKTIYGRYVDNHTKLITVPRQEATCKDTGYEEYTKCAICGKNTSEIKTIPLSTVHTWGEWVTTKEPKCNETGTKEHECTICQTKESETIPTLGHDYSDSYTVDKEPTCAEPGVESRHCSRCDSTINAREIKATDHSWDSGIVTKKPTATEDGSKTYSCTKCDATKDEVIPALGETHTCNFTGKWKTNETHHWKECTCGEVAEKNTHAYNEGEVTQKPTCIATGIKTYTCETCGYTKTETMGKTQVHTWDDGVVVKESTETEVGKKVYTCLLCGETKEEETPVLKNPVKEECKHINTDVKNKKAASCKEEGYTGDTYCKDCDELLEKGKATSKLEHVWNNGDTIKAPTTEEEGYIKYICTVCNEEKFVKIPKLPVVTTENPDNSKDNSKDNSAEITAAKKLKATISSVKKKNKKLVITMKKANGYSYEIKISTDKKFKKSVKTYKTSKISYTTKKLQKNKTYYIKIRTYKNIDGTVIYGKWSKVKKLKL